MALSTANVTKHLSNLSLDTSKKVTVAPEFMPGRSLANSNSTSPNLFNNSYHSQENVGGTTYFYVQNPVVDPSIAVVEEGAEIVSYIVPMLILQKYSICTHYIIIILKFNNYKIYKFLFI